MKTLWYIGEVTDLELFMNVLKNKDPDDNCDLYEVFHNGYGCASLSCDECLYGITESDLDRFNELKFYPHGEET